MNCSTLQEQAAGSLPSASQVSLQNVGCDIIARCGKNVGRDLSSKFDNMVRIKARCAAALPRQGWIGEESWAEAHEKIARMTLTIKLDRNWSSFQLANSAPPLSVTDSAIAPSARIGTLRSEF